MHKTPIMMCCSAALVLGLAGCDANRTDDTVVADPDRDVILDPTPVASDTAQPTDAKSMLASKISVITGAVGPYLADSSGRALYALEGDSDGSGCTGACLEAWPPLQVTQAEMSMAGTTATTATTGSTGAMGLRTDHLGTTQRPDGTMQVTYNGHPLYHYAKDTAQGMTSGHGVNDWYLVSPEGELIHEGT